MLHTYLHDPTSPSVTALRRNGIDVRGHPGRVSVVFAYFHPLADPHIEPSPAAIQALPALRVTADVVLRFGMLEGDAIVRADRAVYDPQTHRGPRPFAENGSSARQLAVVLNEHEVCTLGGAGTSAEAAARMLREHAAATVVVKRGPFGAEVYCADGRSAWVPAYRSSSVFKIGTGDVFSALFTYHWAEQRRAPEEAADLASRAVAAYCETRALPVPEHAGADLRPVGGRATGLILLAAASDTLGRRWLAEEARFRLQQLGADVVELRQTGTQGGGSGLSTAVLALADGLRDEDWCAAEQAGTPIIVLAEAAAGGAAAVPSWLSATVTSDLASAAYLALWSAAAAPQLDPFS
ncbi:PfkB family carbohydrate kinase [Roseomonas sp. GCM10028921]